MKPNMLASMLALVPLALLANPHQEFIEGPIQTGPQATEQCIQCHEQHTESFMQTSHWTWDKTQNIDGNKVKLGKKNAINNYCVSVVSNEARCTQCHAGYGWEDQSFDFTDATKVDCLVCHDTTGTYQKDNSGLPFKSVNLVNVAQNVGQPVRDNCGSCHFYGGGGDGVKHGDLDSSMAYPDRSTDVHMDADGMDFQCQDCHQEESHQLLGQATSVSPGMRTSARLECSHCHEGDVHDNAKLNRHTEKVACQTCHIPEFAKVEPTKLWWDWSKAGEDREEFKDQFGKKGYMKKKGEFTWGKNVTPEYAWYNGSSEAYLFGDKMDPAQVTPLRRPKGQVDDGVSKIYPFKVHRGKQLFDVKHQVFIPTKVFGKQGYWKSFDWDQAARLGMNDHPDMKAKGLSYSGDYGFAETEMWWKLNHMVSPKEQALNCMDCHSKKGRLDWSALGYEGDPMRKKRTAQ
ncbi:tetrathionate reductase family octaheme c-type cytochrome [Ferrimonas aestuarii]|uniref:Tetrathionate reductase family octaheme c-type cytochrome n=1 Tax=Ferrimonas aestuarii TaxID=2569539 RepID=A0A4U1BP57_9GAMM|nr:tetrathionate reductase family octaheme c-type cytochrome [Ferrimonas aestuarii]TKB55486.1 tetrathionate reductase family octaheme c-type cytochrome [Ferrimonas aestuarii]